MKKTATLLFLILMPAALAAAGCRGRGSAAATATTPTTETIAPATGQPAANGGDAVTQTVDVEDGRSEDDGGVLTNPQATKTAKQPVKPPVKKKK